MTTVRRHADGSDPEVTHARTVAALYDVHGNFSALETVLVGVDALGVDPDEAVGLQGLAADHVCQARADQRA